jgi:hypothetical protein
MEELGYAEYVLSEFDHKSTIIRPMFKLCVDHNKVAVSLYFSFF